MLRVLPFLLLAGLTGCTYNNHQDFSPDFGESVHANIASQVVNPVPLQPARATGTNAVRVNSAYDRYQANKVFPPAPVPSLQTGNSGGSNGGAGGAPPAGGSNP